jgi:large repetitive protein
MREQADDATGRVAVWRLPIVRATAIIGAVAVLGAVAAGVWASAWAEDRERTAAAEFPPNVDPPATPTPDPTTPSANPVDPQAPGAPVTPPQNPPPPAAPDGSAAPTVSAPADGIATNVAQPVFAGSGRPGFEVHVQRVDPGSGQAWTIATAVIGADGSWQATAGSRLADGRHELLVLQVAPDGTVSQAARRVIVIDTVVGRPTIDALPTGPQRLLPELTGTGEANALVTVRDENGTTVGATVVGADGRWRLAVPDPRRDGATFAAIQADAAGNISAASPATAALVFSRAAVSIAGTTASDGGSTVVDFTVSGASGAVVEIAVDGTLTGTRLTLSGGSAAGQTPALADASHTIMVRYREGSRVGSWTPVTFSIAPATEETPAPTESATPTPTETPES